MAKKKTTRRKKLPPKKSLTLPKIPKDTILILPPMEPKEAESFYKKYFKWKNPLNCPVFIGDPLIQLMIAIPLLILIGLSIWSIVR